MVYYKFVRRVIQEFKNLYVRSTLQSLQTPLILGPKNISQLLTSSPLETHKYDIRSDFSKILPNSSPPLIFQTHKYSVNVFLFHLFNLTDTKHGRTLQGVCTYKKPSICMYTRRVGQGESKHTMSSQTVIHLYRFCSSYNTPSFSLYLFV